METYASMVAEASDRSFLWKTLSGDDRHDDDSKKATSDHFRPHGVRVVYRTSGSGDQTVHLEGPKSSIKKSLAQHHGVSSKQIRSLYPTL